MRTSNQMSFILPVMLATLLVEVVANPPYTLEEGTIGQGDAMFSNCTLNMRGETGTTLTLTVPFKASTDGVTVTYMRVDNLKPKGQQATVSKTEGGVNNSFATFKFVSAKGHGFLFQIYVYGRTPPGTVEKSLTGNCLG